MIVGRVRVCVGLSGKGLAFFFSSSCIGLGRKRELEEGVGRREWDIL